MSISRVVARPLLSAMFVAGGVDAIKNPSAKAKKAEPVALPIAERVPFLPQDPERLVQINGAVMVGAGTLLAVGKFRRLAALTLIGSIIPTTYAGHRFWEEEDEATKAQQRVHFLKNLGLVGGLILEVVDTEGAPSITWRATHPRSRSRSRSRRRPVGGPDLAKHIGEGVGAAEGVLVAAAKASGPAIEQAKEAAGRLPEQSRRAWKQAQKRAAQIDIAQQKAALKQAQAALIAAAESSRRAATRAEKRAAGLDLSQHKAAIKDAQKSLRLAVKQGRAKAQPVISTATSRAVEAWSHLPVGS